MCEICSKLTIKAYERRRHSGVFIVNFEHVSHLALVSVDNFELVINTVNNHQTPFLLLENAEVDEIWNKAIFSIS